MASQLLPPPASGMTPPTPECHVEVRPSPTSGNGLFATKDIPAGSTILLKSRPLIGELDLPRLEESCHNCFMWSQKAVSVCAIHAHEPDRYPGKYPDCSGCQTEGEVIGVKACTGCKKVRYCSKVCFSCYRYSWNLAHVFLFSHRSVKSRLGPDIISKNARFSETRSFRLYRVLYERHCN
jgi:hypothetical protein